MSGDLVKIGGGKDGAVPGAGLPAPRQDSTLRLVSTLALAGLLSGLAIVGAYEITGPMIAANKARALKQAVFEVVPGAESLQRVAWRDGELKATAEEAAGEPVIYAGYDAAGAFRGWAVPGEAPGYQDLIKLLYGFDPSRRRVVGMEVLESHETPGLGDRIWKDDDFVAAFRDLAIEPDVELVKGGASADNQVDGITGATISSRTVVRIINQSNAEWLPRLPEPGEEPAYVEEGAGEAAGENDGG